VRDEITAQAPDFTRFDIAGPSVALSPKAAESLTLAVHELATNALKHGAFGDPQGNVRVRWSTVDRAEVPWLMFEWMESPTPARAPGAPDGRRRRGFGAELIEQRIPYELGGKGRLDFGPGGVRCNLEMPLGPHMSVLESSIPALTSVFGGSADVTGVEKLTGKTILVVEDEFYIARDMAAALTSAGAKVAGPCASEETTWAELLSRRPDAAVLDLNLGHGPSFKLAEYLRNRDIPFVFVTGYNKSVQPEGFTEVPWLRKPVNHRQVIAALARLLGIGPK
jgi:CheY-like chemotaxis protein